MSLRRQSVPAGLDWSDRDVVVELNLSAAYPAYHAPAMLPREIAQPLLRNVLQDLHFGGVRNETFRFRGKHIRNFCNDP